MLFRSWPGNSTTFNGDDFVCERGFFKNGDVCSVVKLPENAVLEATGNGWTCIATYQKVDNKCVKVELPKDAKFFDQGFDWYCNNQFRNSAKHVYLIEAVKTDHIITIEGNTNPGGGADGFGVFRRSRALGNQVWAIVKWQNLYK